MFSIKKVSVTLLGNHNHFLDHHSYFLEGKSRKFYESEEILHASHTEGSDAASSAQLISGPSSNVYLRLLLRYRIFMSNALAL